MIRNPRPMAQRSDLVAVDDGPLAAALAAEVARRCEAPAAASSALVAPEPVGAMAGAEFVYAEADDGESTKRKAMARRAQFSEDPRQDPNGFERIIGQSNLLSINFLDRGKRAAQAVCRIAMPTPGGIAYGTGFLVGPRLLLTNNHVLASKDEAAQARAEFGLEHDLDGVLAEPVTFNFDESALFYTSRDLDFTLVAVTPQSTTAVPLDRFGWLPLLPLSGKVVDGEAVTIIQHPGGEPKQIAIHASEVMVLDAGVGIDTERFIHYSSDTEPGSSGSPVFNDQWQVFALHHKAVPEPVDAGQPAGAPVRWLANEGVRVSAIFNHLERDRFEDPDARRALDRLARAIGLPPLPVDVEQPGVGQGNAPTEQFAPFKVDHWKGAGLGYDPEFLSETIPLAPIFQPMVDKGLIAPLASGSGHELKYFHYSSVLHAERCFPAMTAVNIDGNKLIHPGGRKDTWRQDKRIDPKYQPDDAFYSRSNKLPEEKVYFSRGHLVRLLDPCWGETQADAIRGMEDTFHFTNAAPQQQSFNDIDWGNLEDYLLDKAQTIERKLTVFTGPIYRPDDPLYGRKREGGPWQIPLSFWKIAVLQKTDTRPAAAAFVIGQTEYVRALYEARVFSGLKPYSVEDIRSRKIQTTVAEIEGLTGLDFSAVRPFDGQGGLEATRKTKWFDRLDDVVI